MCIRDAFGNTHILFSYKSGKICVRLSDGIAFRRGK